MSLFDRFFNAQQQPEEEPHELTDADLKAKIRDWDGKPIVRWSWENVMETYGLAPHWHVKMTGPMIPWVGTRAALDVMYLIAGDRDEAIAKAYERAHETALAENMPWNPEEWHVVQCLAKNSN